MAGSLFYIGDAYVFVSVTPVNEFPPVFNPTTYFFSVSELLGRKKCTATYKLVYNVV